MSKEQLAEDYCEMKQRQDSGQFSDHELFIIRFAFMAGYDANRAKPANESPLLEVCEALIESYQKNGHLLWFNVSRVINAVDNLK